MPRSSGDALALDFGVVLAFGMALATGFGVDADVVTRGTRNDSSVFVSAGAAVARNGRNKGFELS